MDNKNEKHRFVVLIDKDVFKKFKTLAAQENRTAGNLGAKLIIDYVNALSTKEP